MEVHDDPPQAKSDGANALDLKMLPGVLDQLIAVHAALKLHF
jgi:2-dehydro-3-deoxyphosphooctonate aldolase (KDO 8-P synthase)